MRSSSQALPTSPCDPPCISTTSPNNTKNTYIHTYKHTYLSQQDDEDKYVRQKSGRDSEAAGVVVDGEVFVQHEVPAVPPGVDVLLSRAGEEGCQARHTVVVARIQSQQPSEEALKRISPHSHQHSIRYHSYIHTYIHTRCKISVLIRIVRRFNIISSVAVCDGGSRYQLCHPNSVKVNAATMPKKTHTGPPSGRMADAGRPNSSTSWLRRVAAYAHRGDNDTDHVLQE